MSWLGALGLTPASNDLQEAEARFSQLIDKIPLLVGIS
jgi:hypothetical protein